MTLSDPTQGTLWSYTSYYFGLYLLPGVYHVLCPGSDPEKDLVRSTFQNSIGPRPDGEDVDTEQYQDVRFDADQTLATQDLDNLQTSLRKWKLASLMLAASLLLTLGLVAMSTIRSKNAILLVPDPILCKRNILLFLICRSSLETQMGTNHIRSNKWKDD